ncbi:YetF domain-containing protein [Piscibacillus halophilus]|uniref:YetF domain-containing protein n=1 Tax=Piscibacillus halophilus TaxID=571933 RepID=UPI00158A4141|nr:DUF421 domain-containing protein [Piscibacillus halophilus]
MSISELLIRLIIAFVTLLTLTRIMGRKEISQMTFFNFVSGISIGTIGASLAINPSLSIRNGLIALIFWSLFTICIGIIDINSRKFRLTVEGQPAILIKKGKIMEHELQKARLDIDALNALLRKNGAFSVKDVDYAIFETDGSLSVLKKEPEQVVTKMDMNIKPNMNDVFPIATSVISDGRIIMDNLKKLNIDMKWIEEQLKSSGFNSITDIFYAEVQKDGTLYIDTKNDT